MNQNLVKLFSECRTEKNSMLIPSDIIQGLRNLYDELKVEEINKTAFEVIEVEEDLDSSKNR
ncbi:hypothetical protein CUU66_16150 [Peribacillus deserti]|uniref:Uncharacterized protein n=1 Tax=Peribacillus deserti TaxID=673318 RepID=A0A2N5M3D7_9BACI|nr:hypothetical protein CUU66_16150 [Peribacillus deserti]